MELFQKYINRYSTFKIITYTILISTIFVVYKFPEYISDEFLSIIPNDFQINKQIKYKQGKVKTLKIDFCEELCDNENVFKSSCLRECELRSKETYNYNIN